MNSLPQNTNSKTSIFSQNQIKILEKFPEKIIEIIQKINPDTAEEILGIQESIQHEKIERIHQLRTEYTEEFHKRKKNSKVTSIVNKMREIPNELSRADMLTYEFKGFLDGLPYLSQAILYYFGLYPISLTTKQVSSLLNEKPKKVSVYLLKLKYLGILKFENRKYSVVDPILLQFLVMRFNRTFQGLVRDIAIDINNNNAISDFIKDNSESISDIVGHKLA